jgi:hypothetical protein
VEDGWRVFGGKAVVAAARAFFVAGSRIDADA